MEPHWEGVMKVCVNGPGHIIKMAAIYMVKTFFVFGDIETGHGTSGTQVYKDLV